VWVSSTMGTRWSLITDKAPWAERDNLNGEVTADGIIVFTAGYNNREAMNDVWISADGGYSWGNCLAEASFSDRRWQMTALDGQGFLYVAGGEEYLGGNTWAAVNDVWKSTFSIKADQYVKLQKACNIVWPQCTTGLSCWPGQSGTRITYDIQGRPKVMCPLLSACEIPVPDNGAGGDGSSADGTGSIGGSSANTLSNGTAALIAVLVSVTVITLAYLYYRQRQSAGDTSKLAIKLDGLELLGPDTHRSTDTNPLAISLTSQTQPV